VTAGDRSTRTGRSSPWPCSSCPCFRISGGQRDQGIPPA
jgi:hypothetical protein